MIVISFYSTNYTFLAEKFLKDKDISIMIIATPRIITRSCGMSIKFEKKDIDKVKEILIKNKIQVMGIYEIEKNSAKKLWENNI